MLARVRVTCAQGRHCGAVARHVAVAERKSDGRFPHSKLEGAQSRVCLMARVMGALGQDAACRPRLEGLWTPSAGRSVLVRVGWHTVLTVAHAVVPP